MREQPIEFNESLDISAYNQALDSNRCEYCLEIYYHKFELSLPIPHYYKNDKFKWVNICGSCKDQIDAFELAQVMEKELSAAEEVWRSGFPLTNLDNGDKEEPSAFFF